MVLNSIVNPLSPLPSKKKQQLREVGGKGPWYDVGLCRHGGR